MPKITNFAQLEAVADQTWAEARTLLPTVQRIAKEGKLRLDDEATVFACIRLVGIELMKRQAEAEGRK